MILAALLKAETAHSATEQWCGPQVLDTVISNNAYYVSVPGWSPAMVKVLCILELTKEPN